MNKYITLLHILFCVVAMPVHSERVKDLTSIQGVRDNPLIGYGIVVGLDGTGDQTMQAPFTSQSLNNMLSQMGITVPPGSNMQLKNIAAVMVTAKLSPFAHSGQSIDVVVSSMGNAKSLRGGTLLMTPLKGSDGQIYAMAQGHVLVGGVGVSSGGNSLKVNQLNGGSISGGAIIEREITNNFARNGVINLQLNENSFALAQSISDAINHLNSSGTATPLDPRTVQLNLPKSPREQVKFLAKVQDINVKRPISEAKVVINSRTGSVVINRSVELESCAVAHGSLSVTVERQTQVSQPNTAFAGGQTVVTRNTNLDIREKGDQLQKVNASVQLNQVIQALNRLGATPTDLMSILQAMESAGCLRAKLEII